MVTYRGGFSTEVVLNTVSTGYTAEPVERPPKGSQKKVVSVDRWSSSRGALM